MSIDRYIATKKTDSDKYKSTKYPKFPKKATDLYIISRELDRLDQLSNEFYKDPRYWWIIAEANPILGKGTLLVPPGIQLRIPYPLVGVTKALKDVEDNR
jgi:nucleoid-associated protein YgaU